MVENPTYFGTVQIQFPRLSGGKSTFQFLPSPAMAVWKKFTQSESGRNYWILLVWFESHSGSFEKPDHNPNHQPSVASCFVTEGFVVVIEASWAPVRVSTVSMHDSLSEPFSLGDRTPRRSYSVASNSASRSLTDSRSGTRTAFFDARRALAFCKWSRACLVFPDLTNALAR